MTKSIDIACTLGAAGLAAQCRRWEQLMAQALTGRAETPDGLRLDEHLVELLERPPLAHVLAAGAERDTVALSTDAAGYAWPPVAQVQA